MAETDIFSYNTSSDNVLVVMFVGGGFGGGIVSIRNSLLAFKAGPWTGDRGYRIIQFAICWRNKMTFKEFERSMEISGYLCI